MKQLKTILLSAALGLALGAGAQEKMNVLFIPVDDLKTVLGCYGDSYAITPNIDALAKEGILFNKAYCQQSVCGATRPSLLTGQMPDQTRIWGNSEVFREKMPDIVTLPQHFKENGYYSVGIGKIYHQGSMDGPTQDAKSWNVYLKEPNYPKEYGTPLNGYQDPETKAKVKAVTEQAKKLGLKGAQQKQFIQQHFLPHYECYDIPDDGYMDGQSALQAIEVIKESAKTGQPFFLACGFMKPHLPFVAPKKYFDMYDPAKLKLAEFQEKAANSPDIAYHSSSGTGKQYTTPGFTPVYKDGLLRVDSTFQRKYIHAYYAATSYMDAQLGKVIEALKETGLDKNTIIVFWGDHGWHLGDHSLWNKTTNFENATHSPFIIVDPRAKKPGIVSNQMVEFLDVYPTLCDLAGLPAPASHKLQGTSLRPLIYGTDKPVKDFAVSQFPRSKDVMGYSVRTKDFRYTVWIKNHPETKAKLNKADIIAEEFYDYVNDPLEKVSQQDNPKYKKQVDAHRAMFEKYFNEQRGVK